MINLVFKANSQCCICNVYYISLNIEYSYIINFADTYITMYNIQ